nr:hypothetical protein Iba_chr01fCG5200 [Ipomoea batatas]
MDFGRGGHVEALGSQGRAASSDWQAEATKSGKGAGRLAKTEDRNEELDTQNGQLGKVAYMFRQRGDLLTGHSGSLGSVAGASSGVSISVSFPSAASRLTLVWTRGDDEPDGREETGVRSPRAARPDDAVLFFLKTLQAL